MSTTLLGLAFAAGAIASGIVAYFGGATWPGTIAKTTTLSFLLLTVAAFLI